LTCTLEFSGCGSKKTARQVFANNFQQMDGNHSLFLLFNAFSTDLRKAGSRHL
jgi:hypothetical protein